MKNFLFTFVISILSIFTLNAQNPCPGGGTGGGGTSGGGGSYGISTQGSGGSSSSFSGNNSGINYLAQFSSQMSFKDIKQSYAQIDGTPFLNKEPIKGTIITNRGDKLQNIPLQIDMYTHDVVVTNEEGEEIILDGKYYKKIIMPFEGEDLVFMKPDPKKSDQFFQVLHDDGNIVFFKEDRVVFTEGTNRGVVVTNSKFSRKKTNYFIKTGDDAVVRVKLKKKDIFSVLPDAELMAMKDYAQRKGIRLKDETDFVTAFHSMHD